MARTTFNNGDQLWANFLTLFAVLKADTRLSAGRKLQLVADYNLCVANAATTGAPPDIQLRFIAALREVMNKKQA